MWHRAESEEPLLTLTEGARLLPAVGAWHWLAQSPAAPLTPSEAGSVLAPRWRLRGLRKGVKFACKGAALP